MAAPVNGYTILLMNPGPEKNGPAKKRRDAFTRIVEDTKPSIIFTQECNGTFVKELSHEYQRVGGNEAGFIFNVGDFLHDDLTFDTGLSRHVERLKRMQKISTEFDFLGRVRVVRFKSTGVPNLEMLAVSWHGQNNNIRGQGKLADERKIKFLKDLFVVVHEMRMLPNFKNQGGETLPVIVGGDFNVMVTKWPRDPDLVYHTYWPSKRRENNVIDLFVSTKDLTVKYCKVVDMSFKLNDGKPASDYLSHDPIQAVLTYSDGSDDSRSDGSDDTSGSEDSDGRSDDDLDLRNDTSDSNHANGSGQSGGSDDDFDLRHETSKDYLGRSHGCPAPGRQAYPAPRQGYPGSRPVVYPPRAYGYPAQRQTYPSDDDSDLRNETSGSDHASGSGQSGGSDDDSDLRDETNKDYPGRSNGCPAQGQQAYPAPRQGYPGHRPVYPPRAYGYPALRQTYPSAVGRSGCRQGSASEATGGPGSPSAGVQGYNLLLVSTGSGIPVAKCKEALRHVRQFVEDFKPSIIFTQQMTGPFLTGIGHEYLELGTPKAGFMFNKTEFAHNDLTFDVNLVRLVKELRKQQRISTDFKFLERVRVVRFTSKDVPDIEVIALAWHGQYGKEGGGRLTDKILINCLKELFFVVKEMQKLQNFRGKDGKLLPVIIGGDFKIEVEKWPSDPYFDYHKYTPSDRKRLVDLFVTTKDLTVKDCTFLKTRDGTRAMSDFLKNDLVQGVLYSARQ